MHDVMLSLRLYCSACMESAEFMSVIGQKSYRTRSSATIIYEVSIRTHLAYSFDCCDIAPIDQWHDLVSLSLYLSLFVLRSSFCLPLL